jgi:hypothetical protein
VGRTIVARDGFDSCGAYVDARTRGFSAAPTLAGVACVVV